MNGAREDFNGFLLDGVYNIDPKLNTPGVRPPVDAIREFQVHTSTYDASFGRNAGGQINVITKSGANTISGSAYEFFRNGALASRNHFAPQDEPAPDYSRHQFGGSIGGPIVRNRTFFFADYERTHLREGVTRSPTCRRWPSAGGISRSRCSRSRSTSSSGSRSPAGCIPEFFSEPGRHGRSPRSTPSRIAARPFANFVSSPTRRDDVDQADARIDQSFGGGRALTARYSFSDRRLLRSVRRPGVRR